MTPSIEQWRVELYAQGYAPKTVQAKTSAVRLAAEHAGVEPDELSREDVLSWIGTHPFAAWTRRKYLSHVKAWCDWAGILDATLEVRRPRQPSAIPRPVSEAGLAAMLAVARPGYERAWIILGAYAGLRSFETAKVRAGDLTCPAAQWLLEVEGKGAQLALIPVPDAVVEVLHDAERGLEPGALLWPAASAKLVQRVVVRVGRRAGVACTSHQLRHRYGTQAYAATHDLLGTQQLMRHASPATTQGYARLAPGTLGAIVASLPGAGGEVPAPERSGLYLVR